MSYTDTPSARFLFAILKQKSLKDIDWNLVASDPVLAQPITNGHAARMRFSRLRTVLQGPTHKQSATGPTNDNKFRITKSRKEGGAKKPANPKISTTTQPQAVASQRPQPIIKQEPGTESPIFSPYMDNRVLTPCSDDTFPQTPHMPQTPDMATHPTYFLNTNAIKTEYPCKQECDDSLHDDHMHLSGLWDTTGVFSSNFDAAFTEITGNDADCDHSATQDLAHLTDSTVMGTMASVHGQVAESRNFGFGH